MSPLVYLYRSSARSNFVDFQLLVPFYFPESLQLTYNSFGNFRKCNFYLLSDPPNISVLG